MKFTLEIDCDNAAFEDDPASEVEQILTTLAERGLMGGVIVDTNGNVVGHYEFVSARTEAQHGTDDDPYSDDL